MKILLLTFLSAVLSFAQIELTFTPQTQKAVRPIVGKGNLYTVWMVRMSNDYPIPKSIDEERVMRAAPAILEIPGRAAQDLLSRQASADPHNLFVRILDATLPIFASGATTYGLTKKNNVVAGAGLGAAVVRLIRAEVASRSPAPSMYYGDQLPPTVTLPALGSHTYAILADFDSKPQIVVTQIVVP
ncbi:MAG: hypothetical protein OK436_06835, partial [Thaumarchaeota archaeon]|nr:hypothetical protein [Nitrososphaerota archaeon]